MHAENVDPNLMTKMLREFYEDDLNTGVNLFEGAEFYKKLKLHFFVTL